jgi:hypothetical protein
MKVWEGKVTLISCKTYEKELLALRMSPSPINDSDLTNSTSSTEKVEGDIQPLALDFKVK